MITKEIWIGKKLCLFGAHYVDMNTLQDYEISISIHLGTEYYMLNYELSNITDNDCDCENCLKIENRKDLQEHLERVIDDEIIFIKNIFDEISNLSNDDKEKYLIEKEVDIWKRNVIRLLFIIPSIKLEDEKDYDKWKDDFE